MFTHICSSVVIRTQRERSIAQNKTKQHAILLLTQKNREKNLRKNMEKTREKNLRKNPGKNTGKTAKITYLRTHAKQTLRNKL